MPPSDTEPIEAVAAPGLLQVGKIAGAFGAEAEIVADQQPAGMQAMPEHVLDEFLRRLAGKLGVEVFHHHAVDAVAAQAFQLVAQQRDACGGLVRGEELAGMRLEGHLAQGQAARVRRRARARQQRLVAAMHTVEIADGERAGRPALGVGQAAEDFHGDGGKRFG